MNVTLLGRSSGLALLVALLGIGCSGGKSGTPREVPPQEVTVVTLKPQPVNLRRELTGRVSARLVAEVRPQVSGLVRKVLFTEGSTVTAGQKLYQLDDAAYRASYSNADAAVSRAQVAVDAARRNATRGTELVSRGMISTQQNDDLQTALKQAEADLTAASAARESQRVNLAYARIVAPISGRIGKSTVTEGALVVANQGEALATVQQLDSVYIDVTQSSAEWLLLRRELGGDSAHATREAAITLEDGSRFAHDGVLQFADVTVDQMTGSFLLRVLVPNPEGLLMPGMYASASISEGVRADALLAPQQGITRDIKGKATALVVGADNKVQPRQVVVSRTIGDQWLVSEGLRAGDRVIVEGLQKVQPGMPVQPVEAGAAAVNASSAK
jgi:membrane fusion protein (multidrug efflux system)